MVAKAGGMDLLDLMKEGIISPARVVNLKSIRGIDGLSFNQAEGLTLGTLVTLDRIATASEIRQRYVALADAAAHASTPQVRNAATIGGNLLQRPQRKPVWPSRSHCFIYAGPRRGHGHRVKVLSATGGGGGTDGGKSPTRRSLRFAQSTVPRG